MADRIRKVREEGERIVAEVNAHPRRDLIRAIAEVTFDINNENGPGGGMWFHLSQAYCLVEALPTLSLGRGIAMMWCPRCNLVQLYTEGRSAAKKVARAAAKVVPKGAER